MFFGGQFLDDLIAGPHRLSHLASSGYKRLRVWQVLHQQLEEPPTRLGHLGLNRSEWRVGSVVFYDPFHLSEQAP